MIQPISITAPQNGFGGWAGVSGDGKIVLAPNSRLYYKDEEVKVYNPILDISMAMDYITSWCEGLLPVTTAVTDGDNGKLFKFHLPKEPGDFGIEFPEDWDFIYNQKSILNVTPINSDEEEDEELEDYLRSFLLSPQDASSNLIVGNVEIKGWVTTDLVSKYDYTNTVHIGRDLVGKCDLTLKVTKYTNEIKYYFPLVSFDTEVNNILLSVPGFEDHIYIEYLDGVLRVLLKTDEYSDCNIHSCKVTYEKS